MGQAAWNIAALGSGRSGKVSTELLVALEVEVKQSLDLIYRVLALLYDKQSILQVRENLESGTVEGPGFAMELLDLFIAEETKPYLFPILDDLEPEEKMRQLENFYPVEKLDVPSLLVSIINRDYNQLGLWTKACALRFIREIKEWTLDDHLVAQLFHPSKLVKQDALLLAHQINPDKLKEIFPRVKETSDDDPEKELRELISHKQSKASDMINVLGKNQYFKDVPGDLLYNFVRTLCPVDTTKLLSGNYSMGLVTEGTLEIKKNGNVDRFTRGDVFIGWSFSTGKPSDFYASEDLRLYLVEEEAWDRFVFDNPLLAQRFMDLIKRSQE
jgi:hypothetical protein